MKFYGPKKIIELEKEKLYGDLVGLGCTEYKAGIILSEIYSLKGEFLFKPMRTGVAVLLRKKNKLNKEEFESYLESLVG